MVQIGNISSASGVRQSCSGSVAFCQSREAPGTETEQHWWPFTAFDQLLERRQALVCALLREREETRVHGNCHINVRLGMCIFTGGNVMLWVFFCCRCFWFCLFVCSFVLRKHTAKEYLCKSHFNEGKAITNDWRNNWQTTIQQELYNTNTF